MLIVVVLLGVLALFTTGVVSCYRWWSTLSAPNFVYWVVLTVLFGCLIAGAMFAGRIPDSPFKQVLLFLAAVFFIVLTYGSLLLALRGLLLLFARLFHADNGFTRALEAKKIVTPMILSVVTLVGIAGYCNMNRLRLTTRTVQVEKPSTAGSMTVAVVSDMHIGIAASQRTIDKVVAQINAMQADAVFLTGDIFDESTTVAEMEYFQQAFSGVQSTYGSYCILGNHEDYQRLDVTPYFRGAGITLLRDEAVQLGDVTLVGLRDHYDAARKPMATVLQEAEVDTTRPVLLLKHEPLELADCAAAGADVSFSGHTHDEQFPLTRPFVALANDMVCGKATFGSMTAITTAGVGGWGFHFKLPARSELLRVELSFR